MNKAILGLVFIFIRSQGKGDNPNLIYCMHEVQFDCRCNPEMNQCVCKEF